MYMYNDNGKLITKALDTSQWLLCNSWLELEKYQFLICKKVIENDTFFFSYTVWRNKFRAISLLFFSNTIRKYYIPIYIFKISCINYIKKLNFKNFFFCADYEGQFLQKKVEVISIATSKVELLPNLTFIFTNLVLRKEKAKSLTLIYTI